MDTTTRNAQTLLDATEQLEAAETELRVAESRMFVWHDAQAIRELRVAQANLEAARAAYDAAQDLPAPED